MTAVKKFLAGGAVVAALVAATPASAQYFPGYGSPYGGYGSPYGYGSGYGSPYGGYGSPYGYGMGYGSPYGGGYGMPYGGYGNRGYGQTNSYAVGQCMGAVQQRLSASYGQTQYGGARVLGVSDVQPRNNGGMLVSGVANSGRTGGYVYNGGQPPVDLTFTCKTDRSGQVSSIEIGQATAAADPRIGAPVGSPYANDYSDYGYRRY